MGSEPSGALAVVECRGHARVAVDCAEACSWAPIDVFDDRPEPSKGLFLATGDVPRLQGRLRFYGGIVISFGENKTCLRLHREVEAPGGRMVALDFPRATSARMCDGSVVFAGGIENIGADLARAIIIDSEATTDPECLLADGVDVASRAHLAGGVNISEATLVDLSNAIHEYVTIGNRVFAGAGAVVVKSLMNDLTVVGNPVRPLIR